MRNQIEESQNCAQLPGGFVGFVAPQTMHTGGDTQQSKDDQQECWKIDTEKNLESLLSVRQRAKKFVRDRITWKIWFDVMNENSLSSYCYQTAVTIEDNEKKENITRHITYTFENIYSYTTQIYVSPITS